MVAIYVATGRVISTRCVPPTWRRRNTFEAILLGSPVALAQRCAGASLRAPRKTPQVSSKEDGKMHVSKGHGLSVRFQASKVLRKRYSMDSKSVATKQQSQEPCHQSVGGTGGTGLAMSLGRSRGVEVGGSRSMAGNAVA